MPPTTGPGASTIRVETAGTKESATMIAPARITTCRDITPLAFASPTLAAAELPVRSPIADSTTLVTASVRTDRATSAKSARRHFASLSLSSVSVLADCRVAPITSISMTGRKAAGSKRGHPTGRPGVGSAKGGRRRGGGAGGAPPGGGPAPPGGRGGGEAGGGPDRPRHDAEARRPPARGPDDPRERDESDDPRRGPEGPAALHADAGARGKGK